MEIQRFKKKSQIIDMLYMSMVLVMIAVIGLITYHVITDFSSQIDSDSTLSDSSKGYIDNYKSKLPDMVQQLFMIALVGIGIVTLVASFMVMSHPVFYGLMFIVLAFMTWINSIYANFWQDFATTGNFGAIVNDFPMMTYVLQYFPLVILVISIIIVVVMVSKGGQ